MYLILAISWYTLLYSRSLVVSYRSLVENLQGAARPLSWSRTRLSHFSMLAFQFSYLGSTRVT